MDEIKVIEIQIYHFQISFLYFEKMEMWVEQTVPMTYSGALDVNEFKNLYIKWSYANRQMES